VTAAVTHLDRADTVTPRISVVIVSYRRHDEIRRCLRDLARQSTVIPFEIVLVLQDYPDDVTEQLAGDVGDSTPLTLYRTNRGLGVHAARNVGIERARGDVVAFLDDDVRVAPDWITTLWAAYADPSIGGVGGFVEHPGNRRMAIRMLRPILGLSAPRYRIDWGGFHALPWSSHPTSDQDADWLSGCNMSFRRVALEQVGGFDEGYGAYGYDDVDIGLRVRQAGWRLVSSRRLTVRHFPSPLNRASLPDLVRDEEARRVRFVRRAIGHRAWWRARYAARFACHLPALLLQGLARGCPTLPLRALAGARRGMAQFGRGLST
jgi:GT2 family glycosyltransferase